MPRPHRQLPPGLTGRAFAVSTAAERGVTRGRLRGSDLATPFHGVRSSAAVDDVPSLALAYAARMPADHYFSHITAAALLGLRLPQGFSTTALHVTAVAPSRAPRARGVIGHQSATGDPMIRLQSGLRTSDPVSTWCALVSELSVRDLVIVGDGLVQRRRPYATPEELRSAVLRSTRMRGCRRLTAALALIRPGTDSARETILRLTLVEAGLPEPSVNHPIRNRYGALVAHADLAYPDHRVVIEYDGGHHRTDERQYNIDIDRLDELMEEGWRVIRVNKSLLQRHATLIGRVRAALDRVQPPPNALPAHRLDANGR